MPSDTAPAWGDAVVRAFADEDGRLLLALNVPEGDEPPSAFQLFGAGLTHTTKGDVLFDNDAADAVLAALAEHGKDQLPIDYDHGMLSIVTTPDSGKAAGWFTPAIYEGALWASDVQWTPRAADALKNREFRFYSPAVELDSESRRVKRLINVALTNLPATKGQSPLVASEATPPGKGESEKEPDIMSQLFKLLGANDEAEACVIVKEHDKWTHDVLSATDAKSLDGALSAIRTAQKQAAESVKLAERIAEMEAAQETAAKSALIASLSEAGKLPPSLHSWAEGLTIAQLEEFGSGAKAAKPKSDEPAEPVVTLTAEDHKVRKQLGLTVEAFTEQRKRELAAKRGEV